MENKKKDLRQIEERLKTLIPKERIEGFIEDHNNRLYAFDILEASNETIISRFEWWMTY